MRSLEHQRMLVAEGSLRWSKMKLIRILEKGRVVNELVTDFFDAGCSGEGFDIQNNPETGHVLIRIKSEYGGFRDMTDEEFRLIRLSFPGVRVVPDLTMGKVWIGTAEVEEFKEPSREVVLIDSPVVSAPPPSPKRRRIIREIIEDEL